MKILHVIRDPNERLALEIAEREAKQDAVSLLLIQDGVLAQPSLQAIAVYALADDLEARGVTGRGSVVDYDGAICLMADHEKVIVW